MTVRAWSVVAVAVFSLSACSRGAEATGSGKPAPESAVSAASGQTVDVFSIHIGDCLSDGTGDNETVSDMKKIDCASPHDYEAYHAFDLPAGAYPGETTVDNTANDACNAAFETFVGKDYDSSDLEFNTLTPNEDSWATRNDREVICLIASADESPLTGTMRGANI
jgi:Septum formation